MTRCLLMPILLPLLLLPTPAHRVAGPRAPGQSAAEDPNAAARQLVSRGQWSQAAAALEQRIAVAPRDAEAHYLLGFTYASQALERQERRQRLEQAAAALRHSLELQPGRAEVLSELGNVENLLGHYDEAIAYYRSALSVNPRSPAIQFNLADALSSRGEADAAIAEYRRLLDATGDGAIEGEKVRTALAQACLRVGRLDEAERELRAVLAARPAYVDAHVTLGNLLVERRDLAAATGAYEQAAGLRPDDANLAFTLCQLYVIQRRDDEALDWLERAVNSGLADRQALRDNGLFRRLLKNPRFLELTN
jgi:tetratricopeptide (TPR) repeat protein